MLNINFENECDYIRELFAAARYNKEEGLVEDTLEEFVGSLPHWFEGDWNYGISKLALLPKDKPYVIKLPLSVGDDYCGIEYDVYRFIATYFPQYQNIFAETKILPPEIFPETSVYIQERAVTFYDVNKFRLYDYNPVIERMLQRSVRQTLDNISIDFDASANWWMNVLSGHFHSNIDEFNTFADFLEDQSLNIDLHVRNIGYYITNDLPVIIDYSSF